MATAYLTDKASSTVPAKSMPSGVVAAVGSYTLSAALVINDTIQGPSIPANAYLLDVIIDTPDLDSNGSPVIVKVSTAPATSVTTGTIKIALLYSMDE